MGLTALKIMAQIHIVGDFGTAIVSGKGPDPIYTGHISYMDPEIYLIYHNPPLCKFFVFFLFKYKINTFSVASIQAY